LTVKPKNTNLALSGTIKMVYNTGYLTLFGKYLIKDEIFWLKINEILAKETPGLLENTILVNKEVIYMLAGEFMLL
jgi:hypothetical protein